MMLFVSAHTRTLQKQAPYAIQALGSEKPGSSSNLSSGYAQHLTPPRQNTNPKPKTPNPKKPTTKPHSSTLFLSEVL